MNNRRLSSCIAAIVDREILYQEIKNMLNKPSNLEIRNGNIRVISQNRFINRMTANLIQLISCNGEVLASFDSYKDCAKFLGVSPQTIPNRIARDSQIKYKDILCNLKKVSSF